MSPDDLEHVAYLGAFAVAGMLYRGDLYRDAAGEHWAEHTMTDPDGSWRSAMHRVYAADDSGAVEAALLAVLEFLHREGIDVNVITMIHQAPVARPVARPHLQSASATLH